MTDGSSAPAVSCKAIRRQYQQQPIAQLEHHYHHQHQWPTITQHEMPYDSNSNLPRLSSPQPSSSADTTALLRPPSQTQLRRSETSGAKAAHNRTHEASDIPVFHSIQTAKVAATEYFNSLSPHLSRRDVLRDKENGKVAGKSTPYDHWKRLRRARTASGNSCASTSSTSSFASYVINSKTLPRDFDLESDDEVDGDQGRIVNEEKNEVTDGILPYVLQHVIAPVLPSPPYPVDPYHFYSNLKRKHEGPGTAAAEVTSSLAVLFAASDIAAIFHPLKCKFKCLKYVHYSHVEFVVRVYKHQEALLIEFQRRSGSILLWDGLYRILYEKLVPIIDLTALPCAQSSGQKRITKKEAAELSATGIPEPSHNLMQIPPDCENIGTKLWQTLSLEKPTPTSGVEAMKIMLTSQYLDAMREGCAGLAELTEDVQNCCLVAHADMVAPLIQVAKAMDLNMSRCAVGALANIALAIPRFPVNELPLARQTAQELRIQATPVILGQLEHANKHSLYSIELLRECARALGAFARLASEVDPQSVVASRKNDERCIQAFRLNAKHRDAQLASHCRAALEQFGQMSFV
ncbi:hypothetical protein CCR75_004043 [Bremia lactucae]|uniref:Uncharacterized protein n=1 Tax=Bremia lactucae TaxID=4779 RepID=A0A976IBH4_BRELC|nr:hypothetical protein CCR75_004043 [Bremia lactucae]